MHGQKNIKLRIIYIGVLSMGHVLWRLEFKVVVIWGEICGTQFYWPYVGGIVDLFPVGISYISP